MSPNHLARKGRRRGGICGGGARGGARGRACNPLPGRSGHHACRHYDRRAGCAAGSGVIVGGVKPAPWTVTTRSLARIAPSVAVQKSASLFRLVSLCGLLNQSHTRPILLLVSFSIPKFAINRAAQSCELRNRDTRDQ